MKTSARFLAVILAVLMIAGAAMTVSAFSDVEEGYAHASAIATLNQLGVIGGYEDGTFKPNNNVERDEMAKLVYVLYTTFETAGKGSVKFDDVAAGNWAAGYISWCSAKSIVGGYGDGTFKPDNNVTYDEALKMVCATLGYTDFDSNLWPTDVRQKALRDLELGKNIEANGSDKLTRGQVAQLLYNALFVNMNETKIDYIYQGGYFEDAAGNSATTVKVPVEVAKTLAADVWAFEETVVRVVATENYQFNDITTKTSDDEKIKVQAVVDGALTGDIEEVALETLGLEAYAENTDALIGLDIMTVEKDGEMIAKATVLGAVKTAEVVISGKNEAEEVITDEVKIDGVLYDDAKKSETLFAKLKVLKYTSGKVDTKTAFNDVANLEYPHMALVMDHEGDGVVDAIAIGYYTYAKVTKVEDFKATPSKEAYTKYSINADITKTAGNATILSTDIADAKTLAKGDVFVYAQINGVTYIDAVVAPVAATVNKIAAGEDATITLSDVGAVSFVDGGKYFKDAGRELDFVAKAKDYIEAKDAQNFYIYNNVVIDADEVSSDADSYNLALLLYVKEAADKVYNEETKKLETSYPAVLLIDGKETTVNLNYDLAINGKPADSDEVTAYTMEKCKAADGTVQLKYTLVAYEVADDGTYILTTHDGTDDDLGDTVVVAKNEKIKFNANTGLYTINGKSFELDDASAIYYTFTKTDVDAEDTYIYLGTYTKANILPKFKEKATSQVTYLLDNKDETYTLLATVITGELEAPDAEAKRTYKNDARLIKYANATSGSEGVDGVSYYNYAFLDMETMKNGIATVDTTTSQAKGAKDATEGFFYGWDDTSKTYEKVTVSNGAVQIAELTGVDATRGIVYLKGATYTVGGESVDYGDGVKLADSVKIFGTAANKVNTYTTFTVETLAELYELAKDNSKTLEAAVGTYFDEDGNLCIAWIIVDNYYYVTANDGTETFTQTYDIVENLKDTQGI